MTGGRLLPKACMAPSAEREVQGGLSLETLAQGPAPGGQMSDPWHPVWPLPTNGWEDRMSARTGFRNGRCREE